MSRDGEFFAGLALGAGVTLLFGILACSSASRLSWQHGYATGVDEAMKYPDHFKKQTSEVYVKAER